jgi:hypothetical protein
LLALTARIAAAAGVSVINPSQLTRALDIVKAWREADIPVDLILDVVAKRLADMRESETVSSLAYFDAAIRKRLSLAGNRHAKPSQAPPALNASDDDDPRVTQIRDKLRSAMPSKTYEGWLGPKVAALSLNGTSVTVTTPSRFMADWVKDHFASAIADASGLADVNVRSEQ